MTNGNENKCPTCGLNLDDCECDFSFFSDGAPDSLRKSGYKNAAYALGELVDNSIEEDASFIDLIIFESQQTISNQKRWHVEEIGILDNGNGMTPGILRCALRHGSGATQLGMERGRKGKKMGKFGVGLPQASLSQCKRLEVWSWIKGKENAHWTYFDWEQPESFKQIAKPIQKPIPEKWIRAADTEMWGESGTLIVWKKLDRFSWKTSIAINRNSQEIIGRMYRNHISKEKINIRLVAHENKPPYKPRWTDKNKDGVMQDDEIHEWFFQANDPLYLDPDAFADNPPVNPAFTLAGEDVIKLKFTNIETGKIQNEEVKLRFSMAKRETREGHDFIAGVALQGKGGAQPHGKHATRNMGLSIVREGRELELDDAWAQGKNVAWERWWGAEVSFGPGMDDIFDVSNNKQHAQNLNSARSDDWEKYRYDDDESTEDIKKRLKDEDYATYVCLTVKDRIEKNLKIMRNQLQNSSIKKKVDRKSRHKGVEDLAKKAVEKRKEIGKEGRSDAETGLDKEEQKQQLTESLKESGLDRDLIEHLTGEIIDLEYDMVFAERKIDTSAFFSVEQQIGSLIIYLNENHVAFKHLFSVLEKAELDGEEMSKEQLQRKATHASAALRLVLAAWARLEDEAPDSELKKLKRIRRDWGDMADYFLPTDDDEYEES
jgi:hypothetical protein